MVEQQQNGDYQDGRRAPTIARMAMALPHRDVAAVDHVSTAPWLEPVRVVIRPSIFREEFRDLELPAKGKTIAELLEPTEAEVPPHCGCGVWLNGH